MGFDFYVGSSFPKGRSSSFSLLLFSLRELVSIGGWAVTFFRQAHIPVSQLEVLLDALRKWCLSVKENLKLAHLKTSWWSASDDYSVAKDSGSSCFDLMLELSEFCFFSFNFSCDYLHAGFQFSQKSKAASSDSRSKPLAAAFPFSVNQNSGALRRIERTITPRNWNFWTTLPKDLRLSTKNALKNSTGDICLKKTNGLRLVSEFWFLKFHLLKEAVS